MRHTRWAAVLVLIGSLAAAGCIGAPPPESSPPPPPPPRPTQVCNQSFNTAAAYQTAFFNLGHADTGWITSDGFVPPIRSDGRAQLPDGRVVWWMSDTMTGTVGSGNSVPSPVNVHNSTVDQSGGCLTPHLVAIPYTSSPWAWPGSAVVVSNNTLEVFSHTVVPASGPPGFDWQVVGTSRTRFSLPALQLLDGPTPMPSLSNPDTDGEAIPFGIRSFFNATDNKVYLYGQTGSLFTSKSWVARAPAGQETNVGTWQFFTGAPAPNDWSSNFADIKPMEFTKNGGQPDGPPIAQLSVVPYGNRYLAGAFTWDTISPDVRAWISDTPWGPWEQQPATTATFQPRTSNQIAYDAHIVNLPGPGPTVVYSVNDPTSAQNQDFTLYRGQFATPTGLPTP